MELCGPCKFRDKDVRAVKYCLTCQESQCKTCADIHCSSKATRKHLLLNVEDLKNDSKMKRDLNQFQFCNDHPGKKLEFFCIEHDHLMCSTCLLNTPRHDYKSVIDIEYAGEQLIKCKLDEQIKGDLECIIDHCKDEERQIQSFIDQSQRERREIQKYMDELRHEIMTQLNKCETKILNEVDRNLKTQFTDLGRQQTILRQTYQTAVKSKDTLQKIANDNSKADLFRCTLSIIEQLKESQVNKATVTTKLFTHSVQVSPAFVSLLVSMDTLPVMQCRTLTNTKTYVNRVNVKSNRESLLEVINQVAVNNDNDKSKDHTFSRADAEVYDTGSPNKDKDARIRGSDTTFRRDIKATKKAEVSQSMKNVQVIHTSDVTLSIPGDKKPSIACIITLHDRNLVISDCKWSRLIRLNEDLTYRDIADLDNPPGHLTAINEQYIAVCIPTKKQIAFISVSPKFKCIRNFIMELTPIGIHALDSRRLLISMVNDNKWFLQIRSLEGKILQDVAKTRSIMEAEHISSLKMSPTSPRYFLQCCKESYAMYCFEANGKIIFRYTIMSPTDMHVDSTGVIYALESFGMLHILSENGILLQKVPIPKKANSVTCNRTLDRLIITRQKSDVLSVYNIIHK